MWPLDGRRGDVIRIGAYALELWRGSSSGLNLIAREALPQRGSLYDVQAIVEPLRALARHAVRSRASLVLESAFAPTLLADTGGVLWNPQQVEALLRHRFGLAYGGPDASVAAWKIRTDYRFGERHALGFAMPAAAEAALLESARSANLTVTGWFPALAWGLGRFAPWRKWARRTGWWVWSEQDRRLLAGVAGGRVEALNPAVPVQTTMAELERTIVTEGLRSGIEALQSPIGAAHWSTGEGLAGDSGRLQRFFMESVEAQTGHSASNEMRALKAAAG